MGDYLSEVLDRVAGGEEVSRLLARETIWLAGDRGWLEERGKLDRLAESLGEPDEFERKYLAWQEGRWERDKKPPADVVDYGTRFAVRVYEDEAQRGPAHCANGGRLQRKGLAKAQEQMAALDKDGDGAWGATKNQ